jgi:hypothetical protein
MASVRLANILLERLLLRVKAEIPGQRGNALSNDHAVRVRNLDIEALPHIASGAKCTVAWSPSIRHQVPELS